MKIPYILCLLFMMGAGYQAKSQLSQYQQDWEIGLWAGGATYFGDITPAPENIHRTIRPAGGVFARYLINPRLAVKAGFSYAQVAGDDKWSDGEFQQKRNLRFFSDVFEVSAQFEFNFFPFVIGDDNYRFTPYIFAGAGGFHFNPQTTYENQVISLHDIGTEGQRNTQLTGVEPYSLTALAIPLGGGIKYNFGGNWSLGLQAGYRFTNTDYLDDISGYYVDRNIFLNGENGQMKAALADRSPELGIEPIGVEGRQRGSTKNNDAYFFTGISISYTFTNLICPTPSGVRF